MRFLINKIKLVVIFVFTCNVYCGANNTDFKKIISEYKITHSLPVNVTSTPRVHITIEPLEGFITKPEYFEAFSNQVSPIVEYIPKGESFEKWSKIITVQCLTGNCVAADKLIRTVMSNIKSQVKRSVVIKEKTIKKDSFIVSKAVIQYQKHDGTVEMLYMEYYSGTLDCSGIQCSEKVDSWLEDKTAKSKAQKIEKSISSCVNVLNF
jgi:hypothetical protein